MLKRVQGILNLAQARLPILFDSSNCDVQLDIAFQDKHYDIAKIIGEFCCVCSSWQPFALKSYIREKCCWCFRNPAPVGSLSHYLTSFFLHPKGSCQRSFWIINSGCITISIQQKFATGVGCPSNATWWYHRRSRGSQPRPEDVMGHDYNYKYGWYCCYCENHCWYCWILVTFIVNDANCYEVWVMMNCCYWLVSWLL